MSALKVTALRQQVSAKFTLGPCSFELPRGSFTAILGSNGAGKSSLLSLLQGQHADSGDVEWNETQLRTLNAQQRAQRIAYVPQHTPRNFPMRAREVVALGRTPWRQGFAWENAEDSQCIEHALEQCDAAIFAQQRITTLSGGEWQRVCIARALAQTPELLLLDEPTAHLDLQHQQLIMHMLQNLQQQGITTVCALHDINLAAQYCDHAILMQAGQVQHCGSVNDTLRKDVLEQVFNIELTERKLLAPA